VYPEGVGGPLPYREPTAPEAEPPDAELEAARALHRRADRIRKAVLVPSILGGIALGFGGYLGLRELFFSAFGAHQPVVTGVVGMLPPVLAAFWLARAASDALVRRALPSWRAELARAHGLSEEALDEHVRVAGGGPATPAALEP
jgi:hypothetical protein